MRVTSKRRRRRSTQMPRWLVRLSSLVRLNRFAKLATKLDGDTTRFLGVGDEVTVRGQGLGRRG
ncbi:MAG: hypothetical protein WBN29_15635 [Polyangiales bacterium]